MEQLHAHDCYQNVTEHSTISGNRVWPKDYEYTHTHNTGTESQASWSSHSL